MLEIDAGVLRIVIQGNENLYIISKTHDPKLSWTYKLSQGTHVQIEESPGPHLREFKIKAVT